MGKRTRALAMAGLMVLPASAQAEPPWARDAGRGEWAWFSHMLGGGTDRQAMARAAKRIAADNSAEEPAAVSQATDALGSSDSETKTRKPKRGHHHTSDQAGTESFSTQVTIDLSDALDVEFDEAVTFENWIKPWIDANGSYVLPVSDEMRPLVNEAGPYVAKECLPLIQSPGLNKLISLPKPLNSVSDEQCACTILYDAALIHARYVLKVLP